MPLAEWNGKYYQSGCGGFCGAVLADKPGYSNTINEALKRGFAAITTDGGHSGSIGDPSWATGDREAVEVYGHGVLPLTHDAGHALTAAFYGTPPSRAYFGGCSNGGRLAAMAAQRYPQLFDGILGGAGVLHLTQSGGTYGSWVVQSNTDDQGHRILTQSNFAAKIPLLEQAVLSQCDAADGSIDGVITTPRQCDVDVNALPVCSDGHEEQCFSDVERAVLRAWYEGPRDSNGKQLQPGMPPGSERYMGFWFLDPPSGVAVGNQLGEKFAKHLGLEQTSDDYSALDFDFDKDPARLKANAHTLDALDPDLSEFRDAGGKYLMWHGWADPVVLPENSLDYYRSVASKMGGYEAIQPFFRLFMMPGHGHCWEIPAPVPDQFDPISILDRWVETGIPPTQILATASSGEASSTESIALCPHPATAAPGGC